MMTTGSISTTSFQDSFWGEDGRGFATLLARLRYGRRVTEALATFISHRLDIEEEHLRKLQRLTKFKFPAEEAFYSEVSPPNGTNGSGGGGFFASLRGSPMPTATDLSTLNISPHNSFAGLLAVLQQTEEQCQRQASLCDALRQRLLWPLEQSLKEQHTVKRQQKQEMLQILKNRADLADSAARFKERYFSRSKELSLLIGASTAGLSPKALQKHSAKVKRAKEAEIEADNGYRNAVYKQGELHTQWVSRMSVIASEFQTLEERRLAVLRQALDEYCSIYQFHSGSVAECFDVLRGKVGQCDGMMELQDFVAKRRTGELVAEPPVYVSYANACLRTTSSNDFNGGSMMTPPGANMAYSVGGRRDSKSLTVAAPVPRRFYDGLSEQSPRSSVGDDDRAMSISPDGRLPGQNVSGWNRSGSVFSGGDGGAGFHQPARSTSMPSADYRMSVFSGIGGGMGESVGVAGAPSIRRPQSIAGSSLAASSINTTSGVVPRAVSNSVHSSNRSQLSQFNFAASTVEAVAPIANRTPIAVRALYSYAKREQDEISFEAQQTIMLLSTEEDPWWYGYLGDDPSQRGLFPSNYVEHI